MNRRAENGTERTESRMNTKQQASAVPVGFCDYKDSVMRVAGMLWVPTMHSRDSQGESSWSSPLRSNGSRDDQDGEAGLVEP
jgi:hypothetical protein